jgi:uncharacterized integral membrane protein
MRLGIVAATLTLLACAAGVWASDEAVPVVDESAVPVADNAAAEDGKSPEHREALRKVAWAAMFIVLILIVFVVFLMIVSRRLRSRYLGWHRKVRFKGLWDVWWSKGGRKDK